MAVINRSMGSSGLGLMLPGLENYTPAVGEKKSNNVALTTEEGCIDFELPFRTQRPVEITETSSIYEGTSVECDSRFLIKNSGITLYLNDSAASPKQNTAGYAGCKAEVIAGFTDGSATLTYYTAENTAESVNITKGTIVTVTGDADGYWHLTQRVHNGKIMNVSYETKGGICFDKARWLTFGFTDSNHRSLKIAADTHIPLDVGTNGAKTRYWYDVDSDTVIDCDAMITNAANAATEDTGVENGREFYVYLALKQSGDAGLVISARDDIPNDINADYTANNTRKIGAFHTLCADAGEDLTATIAAAHDSVAVDDTILVKNILPDDKDGFYNFYNRLVKAVSSNAVYDTITVAHPLAGFLAGQILPESVWCSTFRPLGCKPDGMVYEPDTDSAVDIYLQSGTGRNTKSVYGGTTTRSRAQINHQADMLAVGKRLPTDHEFLAFAAGSNEKTAIKGAAESSVVTTGGHVDTAGRRMVSFTGVEDCCGAVWQWLDEIAPAGGSSFATYDEGGSFGQTYGTPYVLLAGGYWVSGSSCGSRCRIADISRSAVAAYRCGRGSSRVARGE